MKTPYRVYVLQNPAQKFYIGVTADVAHRVAQHNAGSSTWTKGKNPWRLVWESKSLPLSAARKLENRLKRQGRGSGFYSITGLKRNSGS
jgi:predicted GIY-YIG superfamily endonuclease